MRNRTVPAVRTDSPASQAGAPTGKDLFGASQVVRLDGGRRLRLDGRIDFWPGSGKWQVLASGEEHQGVTQMLAFLVQQRKAEGRPLAEPTPIASSLKVLCDYCGMPAQLHLGPDVYPGRKDLAGLHFWVCWACDAWVGTQAGDERHRPQGALAREDLRDARRAAHEAFDRLWQRGLMTRAQADEWLARVTGIAQPGCHIGMLDVDECLRVAAKASDFLPDV